jgi:hypothetical protein
MPCFVSGVKTGAVPLDFVSIYLRRGRWGASSKYLAMTTTAGPLAMAANKVSRSACSYVR